MRFFKNPKVGAITIIVMIITITGVITTSLILLIGPKPTPNEIDFQHGTMQAYMQGRAEGYLEGMLSCETKNDMVLDSVKMILDGESITIPVRDPCFKVFYHIGR